MESAENQETERDFEESSKRRSALLDKLLRMEIDGRRLTDEQIKDQVNSFMFAVSKGCFFSDW